MFLHCMSYICVGLYICSLFNNLKLILFPTGYNNIIQHREITTLVSLWYKNFKSQILNAKIRPPTFSSMLSLTFIAVVENLPNALVLGSFAAQIP